jgi:hypothetical protein
MRFQSWSGGMVAVEGQSARRYLQLVLQCKAMVNHRIKAHDPKLKQFWNKITHIHIALNFVRFKQKVDVRGHNMNFNLQTQNPALVEKGSYVQDL